MGNGKPAPPFSGREIVQAVAAIHPRLREIRFFNTLLMEVEWGFILGLLDGAGLVEEYQVLEILGVPVLEAQRLAGPEQGPLAQIPFAFHQVFEESRGIDAGALGQIPVGKRMVQGLVGGVAILEELPVIRILEQAGSSIL